METPEYDLCVIGGGINGAGVARDAAGRGLKVLLLEQGDLAQGTSSVSTKLIHGGLRYLEFYEFGLVRASLKEREVLLNLAPHIIWPMEFVLPHHKDIRPLWMIRAGLFLYDVLAGRKKLKSSKGINLVQHKYGAPLQKQFKRGFSYSDCWVQDARLVVLNAMDASDKGAEILTRHRCTGLYCENGIWAVNFENTQTGQPQFAKAKMVVNASGPWVQQVLEDNGFYENDKTLPKLKLIKGSHIIVPRQYDGDQAYILQQKDGRIVFAIPYEQDFTLIGTTDEAFDGDAAEAHISANEIKYLCDAYNSFFENSIVPDDVQHTYSGVRGLLDDGQDESRAVTRDYRIYNHKNYAAPFLSIFGGKITTYRTLSEKVVDTLMECCGSDVKGWTGKALLPGGDIKNFDLNRLSWIPEDMKQRYMTHYGSKSADIIKDAKSLNDLGEHYGDHVYEAEIDYLIQHEFAGSAEDILMRRTKLDYHISDETRANITRAIKQKLEAKP